MKTNAFIVDDLKQVVEVKVGATCDPQKPLVEVTTKEGVTYKIHPSFIHKEAEAAHQEVAQWHTRLHQALIKKDLVGCLSIQKEAERKIQFSLSPEELEQYALEDKRNYHQWRETVVNRWAAVNDGKRDVENLIKTLRRGVVIRDALNEPLAQDFIEIAAREFKLGIVMSPSTEPARLEEPEQNQ